LLQHCGLLTCAELFLQSQQPRKTPFLNAGPAKTWKKRAMISNSSLK